MKKKLFSVVIYLFVKAYVISWVRKEFQVVFNPSIDLSIHVTVDDKDIKFYGIPRKYLVAWLE